MRKALTCLFCAVAALSSAQFYGYKDEPMIGSSRVATDQANAGTRVDQKLNDYVSLQTPFKDDRGRDITLGDVIHDRPVILLPIFYQCPGVCTNELDELTRSLRGFKKDNVGKSFDVVVLSIDHSETPNLAAKKKEMYVEFYEKYTEFAGHKMDEVKGRQNTKDGWHFLTGTESSIKKLTDEIGFRFHRDPVNGNIVHPAALVVLTPHGKISRYFLTTEYPQQILLASVQQAGLELVGVRDDRPFYLACVHVDPLTGQRSLNILNVVKTAGLLTLAVLVFSIASMTIRSRRQAKEDVQDV